MTAQSGGATVPRRPALAERIALARGADMPRSALEQLPAEIAARLSPSLAERLSRVARVGAVGAAASSSEDLADRLGGRVAAPGLVRVDTHLMLPRCLGHVRIDGGQLDGSRLHALGLARARSAGDVLFIDVETNGLGTGAGTIAFMIGIALIERGAIRVTQWVLAGFSGEAAMLDAVELAVRGRRAIASYNGKTFDIPLLRGRLALLRRADPFASLAHADLLHAARRLARQQPRDGGPTGGRLSNTGPQASRDLRLCSIEAHWLGAPRVDDVPGSAAPHAWRRWLTGHDPQGLDDILRHNRQDLVALIALACHAGSILAGLFAGSASTAAA